MSGRIRTIKPELLEDEKASALSDAAWRLFVSSWLLADDHGRFRAGARYLAASVWQDTTRTGDATAALAELVQAGRVRVYDVDGQTYAEIPTWARHQRIDNAGKPRVPPPPGCAASDSGHLHSVSPRTSANLRESPRFAAKASESAALPPTSDLRPPTSEGTDSAPSAPPPNPEEPRMAKGDRKAPARRMPDGWRPTEKHRAKAKALGFEADRIAEAFIDHHRAKGSVFADWDAAFGTWIRNEAKFRADRGERVGGPAHDDRPASVKAEEARQRRLREEAQRVPSMPMFDGIGRGGT